MVIKLVLYLQYKQLINLKLKVMTKKEKLILEALQDSRQNLNSLENALGDCESDDIDLIKILKNEWKIEFQEYQKWVNEAKKTIGLFNLDNSKYHKIKILLPKPKRDTKEIENYML